MLTRPLFCAIASQLTSEQGICRRPHTSHKRRTLIPTLIVLTSATTRRLVFTQYRNIFYRLPMHYAFKCTLPNSRLGVWLPFFCSPNLSESQPVW